MSCCNAKLYFYCGVFIMPVEVYVAGKVKELLKKLYWKYGRLGRANLKIYLLGLYIFFFLCFFNQHLLFFFLNTFL